jgi:subtilisin family serine protease
MDRDLTTHPDSSHDALHAAAGGAHDVIEGHYIVLLSEQPAARNMAAEAALESVTADLSRQPGARVNRTYRHALSGFAAELTDEQVEALRRDPRVLSVERDSYVYPGSGVEVQEYPIWNLDRIDQRGSMLDYAYAYTATGEGVTAYVIDSGIRYSHAEFSGRASLGYDFVLEENPENTDPHQGPGEDCMGHGTHVAGTLGGRTHGVAKSVDLVSVRVFGCSGGAWRSTVLAAVDWVTANAVLPAVANMSLGGLKDGLDIYRIAIQNANAAGVNHVVSAGNANTDACEYEPARTPEAITVGASTLGDNRASFSNYGDCVDLYAPGSMISSASHLDDTGFRGMQGTSMAAPHVAGVVALYLQAYPNALPAEVHSAIVANATPEAVSSVPSGTNALVHSLWGSVDFTPPPPPPLNLAATGAREQGNQIVYLTWDVTGDPHVRITRNGSVIIHSHPNSGSYRDNTGVKGTHGTHVHQVCKVHYVCSEFVTTVFGDGGGDDPPPPSGDGPTASFSYRCQNSATCQFTDTSTPGGSAIGGWLWTSSNGQSATTQNTAFTFTAAGSYTVMLRITDANGRSDDTSAAVNCRTHPNQGLRCS